MRSFPLVTLLLLVSCKFDGRVPQGALVGCEANSDCPNDTFCVGFGRCAQRDLYFAAVEGRVSPARIGPNQMVKIKLAPLNALTDAPVVFGVTNQGRFAATLLSSKPESFEYEWSVSPTDSSNDVLFLANIASLGVSNVEIGSVQIDREGPVLEVRNTLLTPPPDIATLLGSNVRDVKMLSNNMNVEFEVVSNETLMAAPEVRLGDTPLVVQDRNGLSYRYKGQLGKVEGLSELTLTAKAIDTQNNESTSQLATLLVDTAAPKAPDVEAAQNVVFVREPNGTLDSPGVPRFTIRAKGGVFEPNSLIVVSSGGGIYSIQKAAMDGSLPETKLPIEVDIQSLTLRSVDLAGNVSPSVKVRDVEVAIFQTVKDITFDRAYDYNSFAIFFEPAAEQQPMDAGVPPIRANAMAYVTNVPEMFFDGTPVVPTSAVGLIQSPVGTCSQTARTDTVQWYGFDISTGGTICGERQTLSTQFFGRIIPSNLDASGATATEYGPFESIPVGSFGMAREYSNATGRVVETLDASVARRFHAAAYDFARAEVVVFGGEDKNGKLLNDTVVYTRTGKVVKLPPTPNGPSPRKKAAFAYNPLLGRLVLHGGSDGTKSLNDTWSFDGKAWAREKETAPPVARDGHSIGYFSQHGLVMSGGETDGVSATTFLVWDSGWKSAFSFQKTLTYPEDCLQDETFKVIPSAMGNAFICRKDKGTQFTYVNPAWERRLIETPPYFFERGPLVDFSDRFSFLPALGLINYNGEGTNGPVYQLVGTEWVKTSFLGSCSVEAGQMACATNDTVRFSSGETLRFPDNTPPADLARVTGKVGRASSDFRWRRDALSGRRE
jgi:Galactose oxidase, central domain